MADSVFDPLPPVEGTPFYFLGRGLLKGVISVMNRPTVEGAEHVPPTGGVVLASNHQSFLDIPLLAGCLRRHVAFVARSTLRQSRVLDFVMRQSGTIFVHRDRADHSAVRTMVEFLRRGGCVALFPEGTRTRTGALGRFRSGAVVAARKAEVPMVPVGIRGCFEVFPPRRKIPRFGPVGIRFGEPLDASAPDALERLRAEVARLADDPRAAAASSSEQPTG